MRARRGGGAKLVLGAVVACSVLLGAARLAQGDPAVTRADDPRLTRYNGVLELAGVPVSGLVEARVEKGVLVERIAYREGVRDGVARAWYEDGAPRYERTYRGGRETGVHRGWYASGQLKFEERFVDGVLEGTAREWFPDGTPYRVSTYAAGHEEGLQRMWYPDGELRANYVVTDGRRFGRLGAKGCTGEDETDPEVAS